MPVLLLLGCPVCGDLVCDMLSVKGEDFMEYIAVIAAAISGFAVGGVWYGALGAQWMRAVGRTKEDIAADKSPLPFIIAFLGALLAAGVMRHMFVTGEIVGAMRCMAYGAGIGAFLIAPWIVLHYAFAGRPVALWVIDAGHTIMAFAAMGLVLGLFY